MNLLILASYLFLQFLTCLSVSALLATIDIILLSASALFSHNIIIPNLKIKNEKSKLRISRGVVLVAGMVAYIAATYADSIYQLLETASSFGTSGILVITIAGLGTKLGRDQAAFFALINGLIATPIAEYILAVESPLFVQHCGRNDCVFCLRPKWTSKEFVSKKSRC
jgi:Na+/proline symporter